MSGPPDQTGLDAALDTAARRLAAGAAYVCCDLGAWPGGLAEIDRLARLRLAAARLRATLDVRTDDDDLRRLITLAGLTDLLTEPPPTAP